MIAFREKLVKSAILLALKQFAQTAAHAFDLVEPVELDLVCVLEVPHLLLRAHPGCTSKWSLDGFRLFIQVSSEKRPSGVHGEEFAWNGTDKEPKHRYKEARKASDVAKQRDSVLDDALGYLNLCADRYLHKEVITKIWITFNAGSHHFTEDGAEVKK